MKQRTTEGNLASFKIFVNSKGVVMTEFSMLPPKDANKVFKDDGGLHEYLENELSSFVQPT